MKLTLIKYETNTKTEVFDVASVTGYSTNDAIGVDFKHGKHQRYYKDRDYDYWWLSDDE